MYDCIIAGGGPIGCYTAYGLSRLGLKVLVLEDDEEIGLPAHCTGIVGEELIKNYNIDKNCIHHRISSVKVHFPSGVCVGLPTPIKPYIVDRVLFDKHLAQRAQLSGAKFWFNSKVIRVKSNDSFVKVFFNRDNKEGEVRGKICIIATGSMANLPYKCGISMSDEVYGSVQIDVKMENLLGIELFLGNDFAPGSFAYAASTNNDISKIGLISRRDIKKCYKDFLELDIIKKRVDCFVGKPRFRKMPFGIPKNTVSGRVMAVGDTACQIKSTTGGGLFYGLKCADILIKTILSSVEGNNFNVSILRNYDKEWKGVFSKEIKIGLFLRSLLESVDDNWWNGIMEVLKTPQINSLIKNYKDFDHHFSFMLEFFKFPQTRKYLIKLVKSNISKGKVFLQMLDLLKDMG